ncbi:BON domain-containing protein [Xanthocytophaga agilis]|nr:BON domain-containing protein [Xanthocytophaga agilis]
MSEAFHRSATIDASRIHIEMIGNRIILKGQVRSLAEKADATKAVSAAPGITCVDNRLEVANAVSLAY